MKTPPKKASKPKAKLGHAAGDTRRADGSSLEEGVAARDAKDEVAGLGDFETQARADIRLPADAHVIGEPVTVTALRNPVRTGRRARGCCHVRSARRALARALARSAARRELDLRARCRWRAAPRVYDGPSRGCEG